VIRNDTDSAVMLRRPRAPITTHPSTGSQQT
jgi:hypothetical protein